METENRSILIFFSIIVLLIFLDHHSAHQMRLNGVNLETPINQEISKIESLKALTESDLASVSEKIDIEDLDNEKLENERFDSTDISKEVKQRIFQPAVEKGSAKTEEIFDKISKISLTQKKLKLKEISLQNSSMNNESNIEHNNPSSQEINTNRLPLLPFIKSDNGQIKTKVFLFFPGFRGRETVMMRVSRTVSKSVNPKQILELIQAGPLYSEKGLVNALDSSIKIEDLLIQENEAKVYVSKSMHQMSSIIRRDRLDQLCLTLFQFKEIKSIRIFVDNIEISELGKGKDIIKINQPIMIINRKIEELK